MEQEKLLSENIIAEIRRLKYDIHTQKEKINSLEDTINKQGNLISLNTIKLQEVVNKIDRLEISIHRYRKVFEMTFWERLKFAFTNKL